MFGKFCCSQFDQRDIGVRNPALLEGHARGTRRTFRTLCAVGAISTGETLWSMIALRGLRTRCAIGTGWTLRTFRTLFAVGAISTGETLWPEIALRALRTRCAIGTGRTLRTFRTLFAVGAISTGETLWPRLALRALRTRCAIGTGRTGRDCDALLHRRDFRFQLIEPRLKLRPFA